MNTINPKLISLAFIIVAIIGLGRMAFGSVEPSFIRASLFIVGIVLFTITLTKKNHKKLAL